MCIYCAASHFMRLETGLLRATAKAVRSRPSRLHHAGDVKLSRETQGPAQEQPAGSCYNMYIRTGVRRVLSLGKWAHILWS